LIYPQKNTLSRICVEKNMLDSRFHGNDPVKSLFFSHL
jgi:hypothetical protein